MIDFLRAHGEQTTRAIQQALSQDGPERSNHRYSTLHKYYLEPLAAEGTIRRLQSRVGAGGEVWAI